MCGMIAARTHLDLKVEIEQMMYRGEGPGHIGYARQLTFNRGYIQMAHISLPFVTTKDNTHIQPHRNDHGDPAGMFVGEIFNYKELGYDNDIECINEMFNMPGGVRNFISFDGFWSYITVHLDRLMGIVDHLGIKPLYYRTDMEAIASEPDILLALDEFDLRPNEIFLSNTMKWGYDPTPRSPWQNIRQVPPGHYVIYDKNGENPTVHQYYDYDYARVSLNLRFLLPLIVKRWMGGFRKVPILLSGGLDSTIIYKLMKQVHEGPIDVIHVENHENEYVDLVLDPDDNIHTVTLDDVSDEEALRIHQTPVDLGSVKPQIAMARKLKQLGYKAVMTGDGADELFGGYRRAQEYDSQMSDIFCELPYYHLPRLDRTLMRETIECRSPFLSPLVLSQALYVPYDKRTSKQVLKEEFADIVPQKILERDKFPLKTDQIRNDPMTQRKINDRLWREMNG
jgi:asparagine synthetase B (glutamine-hydrolysing)